MARYDDSEFTGMDIELDGNEYHGCRFERCRLVYRGGELLSMVRCNFSGCQFVFHDAAARTVNFMRAVYHGMEGGQEVIEQMFYSIRKKPSSPGERES
jgi:hypothetical protein